MHLQNIICPFPHFFRFPSALHDSFHFIIYKLTQILKIDSKMPLYMILKIIDCGLLYFMQCTRLGESYRYDA